MGGHNCWSLAIVWDNTYCGSNTIIVEPSIGTITHVRAVLRDNYTGLELINSL